MLEARDGDGAERPAYYGPGGEPEAVAREYQAAREAGAVVDLADRGLLAVTGPQRVKFLHNLLSNDVAGRGSGQGSPAALMDVRGHLTALMRVLVGENEVVLEVPADRLAVVEAQLVHYRVGAPVRFAARPVVALAVLGPRAADLLGHAGLEMPGEMAREDHASRRLAGVEVRLVRAGDLPGGGFVLHVPPEGAPAVWDALLQAAVVPIGHRALDILRIEAGRPWYGRDVTESNLLHETGLVAEYHSPAKGCYVGQEVIARLEARGGNVNKKLRGLKLAAAASAGAALLQEGRDVGRVTTAGVSPRLGPIAMAYVHRSAAEAGTPVEVEGRPAAVVALPF